MKYIAILAVIIMIVRIDYILGLIERAAENVQPAPVEVNEADISSDRQTLPFAEDPNFKQTPKGTFLALLENFQVNPSADVREKAMAILKANPALFNQKLDKQLEAQIFNWRDLLINNNPEVANFLFDLMSVLQGQNLETIKRFFSLWMDINMENFVAAYSRSKDVNCAIATQLGYDLTEEEKRNEIYEREEALKQIVARENIEPVQKVLATNYLLVLGLEIAKFPPPPATSEQPSAESFPESQTPGDAP